MPEGGYYSNWDDKEEDRERKIGSGKRKGMIIDVLVYFGFHALRHLMASYLLDKEKVSLKTTSSVFKSFSFSDNRNFMSLSV